MAVNWTEEQQKVIRLRDRSILVSAAAGSGKTAVLVQRILEKLLDQEHPYLCAYYTQEPKRPESTQDVFASMMSQVAGRPVHAVPVRRPPPPGAPAAGAPPVGRNDPCPCGSGKKYKKCCGRGQT